MRYPAFEKLEIIRLVETSPLPVRRTLTQIGIPKSTFYAWYERYIAGGITALEDRKPRPRRVWNRIADFVDHYNHRRYHESLDNLTPADVYFQRGQRIIDMRREIKRRTIDQRRQLHLKAVA